MRVVQLGGDLDLAQESLGAERLGDITPQHLDGYLPPVPDVLRQVHRGHPAGPEFTLDGVAVGEGLAETVFGFSHRGSR